MSNTKLGILAGSALLVTGAIVCGVAIRRRNQTLAGRARRQITTLKNEAARLSDRASDLIEKGLHEVHRQKKNLADVMEAGKTAYERIAG
ncbi:MAG TPA: hypothetical protein VG297_19435 [Bryobacteraceae bacterium]|jgi:hypothetical protein|nr:hypothetical protein [Bryobacteraceae bacterium]